MVVAVQNDALLSHLKDIIHRKMFLEDDVTHSMCGVMLSYWESIVKQLSSDNLKVGI